MKQAPQFATALISYFSPGYPAGLVSLLERADYSIARYLYRYWTAQNFTELATSRPTPTVRNKALVLFVYSGALLQVAVATTLLAYGSFRDVAASLPFGLALVFAYPIVWAHLLAVAYFGYKSIWALLHLKTAGRAIVCAVLENQVVRLRQKHKFTVIAVAGSIGKTSTKLAIAHTLEPSRRVIYQTGNYNDRVTVPLVLFGKQMPSLFNIFAWAKIFIANEQAISRPYFYDIAVLELGTDHPGSIIQFAYLRPDISVVTAITPEHMEYFKTLDAVAAEELTVCDFSRLVLVNADDTPAKYFKGRKVPTYGTAKTADFRATDYKSDGLAGGTVKLHLQNAPVLGSRATILGEQGVKILLAAAGAAQLAGLSHAEITKGIKEVKPFSGRMQVLAGVNGATIIDDTYNASPEPVKAALDALYATPAPQRIAILGSMNELGDYSPEAHREVGAHCQADKLDAVVTIGADARAYLAPAAEATGCKVVSFDSPSEAGEYVAKKLKKGAVVLAEGSQNGVFAEEALKVLLANQADVAKLVRQSASWMAIKNKQFPPIV